MDSVLLTARIRVRRRKQIRQTQMVQLVDKGVRLSCEVWADFTSCAIGLSADSWESLRGLRKGGGGAGKQREEMTLHPDPERVRWVGAHIVDPHPLSRPVWSGKQYNRWAKITCVSQWVMHSAHVRANGLWEHYSQNSMIKFAAIYSLHKCSYIN